MQDVQGLSCGAAGEGFGRFNLLTALVLLRTETGVGSLVAAVGSWLLHGFLTTADVGAAKNLAEIFISSERDYRAFRECGGRLPVGF